MGRSNDDYPNRHRRDVVIKALLGIVLIVLVAVDFHLLWSLWTEGVIW